MSYGMKSLMQDYDMSTPYGKSILFEDRILRHLTLFDPHRRPHGLQ